MSLDVTTSKTYTTIPELASEWRVSIAHIHNLINRKQLPAHRVGARYIINRSAAQEFLQKNATVSVAA
jgi:excisionase family DNA binding protein